MAKKGVNPFAKMKKDPDAKMESKEMKAMMDKKKKKAKKK